MNVSGTMVQLQGDWSISGFTGDNLGSMVSALQQIEPGAARTLQIDCQRISAIDSVGQELLSGWMQIARSRNLEPKLINLPDNHLVSYFKNRQF